MMGLPCGCPWDSESQSAPVFWSAALGCVRCHICGRIYSIPRDEDQALEQALARAQREQEWATEHAAALGAENERLQRELAAALESRLLVPVVEVERDICHMSTNLTVMLPYGDFDEQRDRRAFRQTLSRVLNGIGDTFMAAWDRRHGETTDG